MKRRLCLEDGPSEKKKAKAKDGGNVGTAAQSHALSKPGCQLVTTSGWLDLGQGSLVGYWPAHVQQDNADAIFQRLHDEVPWAQKDVVVMGRQVAQPRLIAYYAHPDTGTYTYSKLSLEPTPFTPLLLELKAVVEALTDHKFNSLEVFDHIPLQVLLNLYRNGDDCVGWHSDDEKLYGQNSTIASLSFGQTRDFLLRRKAKASSDAEHGLDNATMCASDSYRFCLGAGDVLVMKGTIQSQWQHCVPRRKQQNQARISCTFRTVVTPVHQPPAKAVMN